MSIQHNHLHNALTVAGRVLLASLFIPAGLNKVTNFAGTVEFVSTSGVPFPEVAVGTAALIEIIAGLAVLIGFHVRWAALALGLFTLLASVLFHAYWAATPDQQYVAQLLFFKNIAVIGGLLSLTAAGPGAWSVTSYLKHHHTEPHNDHAEHQHHAAPLPH